MASTNDHMPPPPKQRLSPLEFRNTDLVSRLLAATPPYLYNMSLLPNTFFFSEMLRSLVHAKVERHAQMAPPMRRSRKRPWNRSEMVATPSAAAKPEDWMIKSNRRAEEDPLELTIGKPEDVYENKAEEQKPPEEAAFASTLAQDANASSLVLPPPPPMWYPPLYPNAPYGIDPLHFFIDLRVSGHIYDRKPFKEQPAEEAPTDAGIKTDSRDIFKKPRHSSAFSVPNPSKTSFPMNLSERENRTTKFDVKSMGFDRSSNRASTNYVMKNVTSIYKNIHAQREETKSGDEASAGDEEAKRVEDLRALLGLELVVDYVKHKPRKSEVEESFSSTDAESVGSPALEVVALQDEN